jgi:hypothetical protein
MHTIQFLTAQLHHPLRTCAASTSQVFLLLAKLIVAGYLRAALCVRSRYFAPATFENPCNAVLPLPVYTLANLMSTHQDTSGSVQKHSALFGKLVLKRSTCEVPWYASRQSAQSTLTHITRTAHPLGDEAHRVSEPHSLSDSHCTHSPATAYTEQRLSQAPITSWMPAT